MPYTGMPDNQSSPECQFKDGGGYISYSVACISLEIVLFQMLYPHTRMLNNRGTLVHCITQGSWLFSTCSLRHTVAVCDLHTCRVWILLASNIYTRCSICLLYSSRNIKLVCSTLYRRRPVTNTMDGTLHGILCAVLRMWRHTGCGPPNAL